MFAQDGRKREIYKLFILSKDSLKAQVPKQYPLKYLHMTSYCFKILVFTVLIVKIVVVTFYLFIYLIFIYEFSRC